MLSNLAILVQHFNVANLAARLAVAALPAQPLILSYLLGRPKLLRCKAETAALDVAGPSQALSAPVLYLIMAAPATLSHMHTNTATQFNASAAAATAGLSKMTPKPAVSPPTAQTANSSRLGGRGLFRLGG